MYKYTYTFSLVSDASCPRVINRTLSTAPCRFRFEVVLDVNYVGVFQLLLFLVDSQCLEIIKKKNRLTFLDSWLVELLLPTYFWSVWLLIHFAEFMIFAAMKNHLVLNLALEGFSPHGLEWAFGYLENEGYKGNFIGNGDRRWQFPI